MQRIEGYALLRCSAQNGTFDIECTGRPTTTQVQFTERVSQAIAALEAV
jgi:hypothetical protein